jgi:hypothetical protein
LKEGNSGVRRTSQFRQTLAAAVVVADAIAVEVVVDDDHYVAVVVGGDDDSVAVVVVAAADTVAEAEILSYHFANCTSITTKARPFQRYQ